MPSVKRKPTVTGPGELGPGKRKMRPMTDKEKKLAQEYFNAYDYDSSGTIDFGELTELLQDLNLPMDKENLLSHMNAMDESDSEVKQMFVSMNQEGTDPSKMKIVFDQFCTIYLAIMSSQNPAVRKNNLGERITVGDLNDGEDSLRLAFMKYDADASGFLDAFELKALFSDLGLPDEDGDGFTEMIERAFKEQNVDPEDPIYYEQFVKYRNMIVRGIEEESESAVDVY
jgi:Ca2+-binding EF-hand superfamily protein